LSQQLPLAEANAIGEAIVLRKNLTNDQQLALMKDEYQLAVDKHKADGTLLPRQKSLHEQLEDLGHQLTGKEQSDILVQARKKKFATSEQTQLWMKAQYETLIAKHKADGTAVKPGGAVATPEGDVPKVSRAEPNRIPESWLDQISRLGSELPDDEVKQVWAEARLKGPTDPAKMREWVREHLEKLVTKHKTDGTLPSVEKVVPDSGDTPPTTDRNSMVTDILHLGLQLPDDEVKQVWTDARRKESDPVKQRQLVKDQLEKLIAKHKADGTLPKPKSQPPDDNAKK
jgi:hypothetical protein